MHYVHSNTPVSIQAEAEVTKGERRKLRMLVADYMESEGCSCCRNTEAHAITKARLAKLLHVLPYADGSGWNFHRYTTGETAARRRK